jgi:hypothetical protein
MGALIPKLTNRFQAWFRSGSTSGPSGRSLRRGSPSLGNSPINPSVNATLGFCAAVSRIHPGYSAERDEVVFDEAKVIARGCAIVGQTMPWDSETVPPRANRAVEAQNCAADIAARLVDYDSFDRADHGALGATHRRSFDTIACDQAIYFPRCRVRLHHRLHMALRQPNAMLVRAMSSAARSEVMAAHCEARSATDVSQTAGRIATSSRNAVPKAAASYACPGSTGVSCLTKCRYETMGAASRSCPGSRSAAEQACS